MFVTIQFVLSSDFNKRKYNCNFVSVSFGRGDFEFKSPL
jgi:hypothetical protein